MVDIFSKKKRSEIMAKVKNKDSQIETRFRKALWANGYRYRKNAINYFGTPDMVLPKYKTVIFIDSCFWHGCRKHGSIPATNAQFWKDKIMKNKSRDRNVNRLYRAAEWRVFRIWEHDLLKKSYQFDFTKIKTLALSK